jgi:LysM repeat protein
VSTAGLAKYTVVSNDSWYGLAGKFGVSVDALLKANNANTNTVLLVGQSIFVPKGGTVPKATTTTKAPATTKPATTTTKAPVTTPKP